jgi:mannose/fructose/N-acetylgalactosamine-specific phosphotransferase system component IIC
MPFDASTWLLLALLGGWIAADSTSVGQLMVSRPIVAATLAGWLLGAPAAGAAVGLVLEVFHLTVLPVGAARYPEGGPPAVIAGALFAVSDQQAFTLLTIVVFALLWESASGMSVRVFRHINSRLLRARWGKHHTEAAVERRHLSAILLDFLRGAVVVLVGLLVLHELLAAVASTGVAEHEVARTVLHVSLVLLLASALRLFGRRFRFVAAGAVAAMILLLLRG